MNHAADPCDLVGPSSRSCDHRQSARAARLRPDRTHRPEASGALRRGCSGRARIVDLRAQRGPAQCQQALPERRLHGVRWLATAGERQRPPLHAAVITLVFGYADSRVLSAIRTVAASRSLWSGFLVTAFLHFVCWATASGCRGGRPWVMARVHPDGFARHSACAPVRRAGSAGQVRRRRPVVGLHIARLGRRA